MRTADAAKVTVDAWPDLLVAGTNVVSVETHLDARSTTDVSFDLTATVLTGNAPPTVAVETHANDRSTSSMTFDLSAALRTTP